MQLDKTQIIGKIKIAEPVLLLDSAVIDEDEQGFYCCGEKKFSGEENFWKAHMIDDNVMPGTYMLEAMSQTAVMLMMEKEELEKTPRLVKIDNVRFYSEIRPGGVLKTVARLESVRHGLMKCKTDLYKENDVLCGHAEFVNMKI